MKFLILLFCLDPYFIGNSLTVQTFPNLIGQPHPYEGINYQLIGNTTLRGHMEQPLDVIKTNTIGWQHAIDLDQSGERNFDILIMQLHGHPNFDSTWATDTEFIETMVAGLEPDQLIIHTAWPHLAFWDEHSEFAGPITDETPTYPTQFYAAALVEEFQFRYPNLEVTDTGHHGMLQQFRVDLENDAEALPESFASRVFTDYFDHIHIESETQEVEDTLTLAVHLRMKHKLGLDDSFAESKWGHLDDQEVSYAKSLALAPVGQAIAPEPSAPALTTGIATFAALLQRRRRRAA